MENCGKLYTQMMTGLISHNLFKKESGLERDFSFLAAGFITGQAEKVYLGSSEAFMIRPSNEWLDWTKEITNLICKNYSIFSLHLESLGEIWGFKHFSVSLTLQFMVEKLELNSPEFHELRARLCGIKEINREYHKSEGFGERCEP